MNQPFTGLLTPSHLQGKGPGACGGEPLALQGGRSTPAEHPGVDLDDRRTPHELFRWCADQWGPFTVDAAASAENTKCPRFYDRESNGLAQCWDGERVWANPPFSDLRPWVAKAWDSRAEVVVMLLPANRTDQRWWHDHIEPFRDQEGGRLKTKFVKARPRFLSPTKKAESPKFGVVFAVWGPRAAECGA